jgi:hypothetical protein
MGGDAAISMGNNQVTASMARLTGLHERQTQRGQQAEAVATPVLSQSEIEQRLAFFNKMLEDCNRVRQGSNLPDLAGLKKESDTSPERSADNHTYDPDLETEYREGREEK